MSNVHDDQPFHDPDGASGMSHHSTRLIKASPDAVHAVLLNAAELAEWNPAFRSIVAPTQATAHQPYPITGPAGLSGHLAYTGISPDLIEMTWQVTGFHETCTWRLDAVGEYTQVTHEFRHSGPLARLLRSAFRGVAELRLDRLSQRAFPAN